jgi:hypothetical protein
MLNRWRRNREHRTRPARPVVCDCGTRFEHEYSEFVAEAIRVLGARGANGPYATLWHAPDCPKNGDQ